jgi:phage tail-like protein
MSAPLTSFRFEVLLDLDRPTTGLESPLCDAAFAECSGLEITMEPKVVESASVTDRQQRLIGPTKYGQITLKRGMTRNLQLWQWMAQGTRPGSVLTAHGVVSMWDTDATPAVQFVLQGCLPVRMRAPSLTARDGLVAVEELGLVCEKMMVAVPGAAGLGFAAGIGPRFSASAGGSIGASASFGDGASASFGAGGSFGASASFGGTASFGGGL